jgi:hypothetical protein
MRPLLGDFLTAAGRHLGTSTGDLCLAAEVSPPVVRELVRLTTVMARCADAFAGDDWSDSRHLKDAQELAVLHARSALRQAAARIHTALELLGDGGDAARPATALHLSAAAGNLEAGHDLLQTHFTTDDQSGWRYGSSFWAPAIASQQVNAALVSEMGSCAGHLATWALQLAATDSGERLPARARAAISEGCRWLWVAEAASQVIRHHPGAVDGHALLHAIPINLPPPRHAPRDGLPIPELCAGTIVTAERLRHLAYIGATHGHHAKAALAASWQRTAQAAAITGHCGELILRQLAEPGTHPPVTAGVATSIEQAARAARKSWQAWRDTAHDWDIFTTNRGTAFTPVASEIGDLVLWAGRLAHTNPAWTPARSHASQLRPSADFTGSGMITAVVTALHNASDALTCIAAHDSEHVRWAAAREQVHIPTRLLPAEDDVPYRYAPARPAMLEELLAHYDTAADAATRATAALDQLVLTLNPQPTTLITLRTATPLTVPWLPHAPAAITADTAEQPAPGRVEQVLRSRGISEPALLARAADLDGAAKMLISSAASITERRARATDTAEPAPKDSPAERQHPARVAAKDSPPATTSGSSLPRLVPIGHQIRHNTATRRRPSR